MIRKEKKGSKVKVLRKKILKASSALAAIALVSISVTSCSSPLNFDSSIQLIVSDNTSTLADQSFSETSYNGIRQYFEENKGLNLPAASSKEIKENNGIWKRPGIDTISRIASYKYAFEDGAKIVVATGFNQQDGLQQITSRKPDLKQFKNSFKDNAFIFVDGTMNAGTGANAGFYGNYDSDPYNVSSISYRADDGSFLTGVSTAVFLNKYQDYFKKNGKLGVSSFVGLAFGSTLNFFNGFRLGIHYWNMILQPLIKTVDGKKTTLPINWVSPVSGNYDISNFTSGSFSANETKAITLTDGMQRNGAAAIFPIAGPQTALVTTRVTTNTSSDFSKTIVVGVDTAQENTKSLERDLPGGANIGTGKVIQFSSVKNLKDSTAGVLNAITKGHNGKNANILDGYYGLGWNNVGTVTNAGVGVSDAGLKYLINPNWNEWKAKDSSMTLENITLEYLLENHAAKQLSTTDPVIVQYNNLLTDKFNTLTGMTTSTNGTKVGTNYEWNTKALKIVNDANKFNNLNGPANDGKWRIFNNQNSLNTFIGIKLSDLLPAITTNGQQVSYPVPPPDAQYIAESDFTNANQIFNVTNMFFRKN